MPQTRFTKEFQDDAVRFALTSGRRVDHRRELEIEDPPAERQEDMAAELKQS